MTSPKQPLSRRDFLKLAGLGAGALAFRPLNGRISGLTLPIRSNLPDFPPGDLLARNCTSDTSLQWGGTVPVMSKPDVGSSKVRDSHRDEVFPWLKEVAGDTIDYNIQNQRWVEVPDGYIRSLYLQPCRNVPNTPITSMPANGASGFWVEVTVPYVDLIMDNPSPASPWMRDHVAYNLTPRLYYSQVMWVDQIRTTDSGEVQYHVFDRYGNPGDLFWADGAAFRLLTNDDISPIHPDVDPLTKTVVVNINYQTLSCFEDKKEVYFCRVSTGMQEGSTPVGEHPIWRKLISVRMSAAIAGGGYDLPGMSWTTFFVGDGVAIHAATSHNNFGTTQSHGCVNCHPEDAKWVFRWTMPSVPMDPGDVQEVWTPSKQHGSTHVFVVDTF